MKSNRYMILFLCVFCISLNTPAFENKNIVKTVDLTNAIVVVSLRIVAIPADNSQNEYILAIPKNDYEHMSYIEATNVNKYSYTIKKAAEQTNEDIVFFTISSTVAFDSSTAIYIYYHLTHVMESLPAFVLQGDIPKYRYTDNQYIISPYSSIRQEIKFVLPSSKYEFATDNTWMTVKDNTITYGPFKDVDAFAPSKTVTIHFPSIAHFITFDQSCRVIHMINSVEREIEVSHWGNVAVEEVVRARNSGTPLSGEFSRLDYMMRKVDEVAEWEMLHGSIDKKATDIYYRDMIGNVTTSHVRRDGDAVNVELYMRFPMMGGWKNEFYWGYNLPSGRVLRKDGKRFSLRVPFSTPLVGADISELSVRIILPECVKNVKFNIPEGVSEPTLDYRYTYLDTATEGRPVYEFKKNNLIDKQKDDMITITYELNAAILCREPFMCIGVFFFIFLIKAIIKKYTTHVNKEKTE